MTEEKPSGVNPDIQVLTDKGLVPRTTFHETGMMSQISWEPPHVPPPPAYHMGFPEALVLVTLLIFLLFLVKGVPWG